MNEGLAQSIDTVYILRNPPNLRWTNYELPVMFVLNFFL